MPLEEARHLRKATEALDPRRVSRKSDCALVRLGPLREMNVETSGRTQMRRAFRPFDDGRAVGENFVETEFIQFVFACEAIEIEMRNLEARCGVALHQ